MDFDIDVPADLLNSLRGHGRPALGLALALWPTPQVIAAAGPQLL